MEGQQSFEIMLVEGRGHADEHGQSAQQHDQVVHGLYVHDLEHHVDQTDHAVDAGLVHHAREHHGDGGRSSHVGVRRDGVEGHDEGFDAEADEQQGKGEDGGGGQPLARQQGGDLGQVQGVDLGVDHDGAHQDHGRADGAHGQILEGRFQGAFGPVAVGGEGHGGEGHDLHHDEDVEQVAGQHQAQHAAGQHQEQSVVFVLRVVAADVFDGVDGGQQHREGDQQSEEQGQGVHLDADADGVARLGNAVAQPVADDAAVDHDGLDQQAHHDEGDDGGQQHQEPAHGLIVMSQQGGKEGAQEIGHYREDR